MWGGYLGLVLIVFAETGLLFGFFLPGDSLLVTAGLFAATGTLNIVYVNIAMIPAAIAGNIAGYWIGHKSGKRLFRKEQSFFFRKDYLLKTKNFYDSHGGSAMIVTRFMPIFRTFIPVIAGMAQMKYSEFLKFNIIGAFAWIISLTMIGYFLGSTIPNIDKHIEKVIIIIIILSMLPGIIKYLKHKFTKKPITEES